MRLGYGPLNVTNTERLLRLQRSVTRLASEVRALRGGAADSGALRLALRRRGLTVKRELHDGCVLPHAADQAEYYALLSHYSFRLFLRDVIKHRDGFGVADLVRYCSPATARRYLRWLCEHKMVRSKGRKFALVAEARSFGPTLEWFVAAVLWREFGIRAGWNLRLSAASGGGDYDVIGFEGGSCTYIEAKSSPPRNIDSGQIRAFFDRLNTLRPQIAIFLNDTQLRMGDKIAVLFRDEVRRRFGSDARTLMPRRLDGEVFAIRDRVFIINSDPDLVGNIGICLARHYRAPALNTGVDRRCTDT